MVWKILASAAFAFTLLLGACDAPEGGGEAPQPDQQMQD